MYIGIVERAKKTLKQVAIDKSVQISADGIMELLVDSLGAIKILEDACFSKYSEGRADGMERMAEILCGTERSEQMSLYNAMFGFNPACVLIMPMLGRKDTEYPRFRNCFVDADKKHILIYTRAGGGNRGCGFGEEQLYEDENFVTTYDDDFDNTYATYEFKVPSKWEKDFDLIIAGKLSEVSDEYVDFVKSFYPKLTDKIDELFERKGASE